MTHITVRSFGCLHISPEEPLPGATVTVDVRDVLFDPAVRHDMRELTGLDTAVRRQVAQTRGSGAIVARLVETCTTLLKLADTTGAPVSLNVGCAGGRHRSVVIAAEVARQLVEAHHDVVLDHLHIHHRRVLRAGEQDPNLHTGPCRIVWETDLVTDHAPRLLETVRHNQDCHGACDVQHDLDERRTYAAQQRWTTHNQRSGQLADARA